MLVGTFIGPRFLLTAYFHAARSAQERQLLGKAFASLEGSVQLKRTFQPTPAGQADRIPVVRQR